MNAANHPEESPAALVSTAGDAFGPLRALGECQLQIQFTISSTYDTQAMGLLGLDGALAVAADSILGHLWWLTLIGLGVSAIVAAWALFVRADHVGLDLKMISSVARGVGADEMNRAIVLSLSEDIDANDDALEAKRDRVWTAMLVLLATVLITVISVLAL